MTLADQPLAAPEGPSVISVAHPGVRVVGHFRIDVDTRTGIATPVVEMDDTAGDAARKSFQSRATPGAAEDLVQNRNPDDGPQEDTFRMLQDVDANSQTTGGCETFWNEGWAQGSSWRFWVPLAAQTDYLDDLHSGGSGLPGVAPDSNRFCTNFELINDYTRTIDDLWIVVDGVNLPTVRGYVSAAPRTVPSSVDGEPDEILEPWSVFGLFQYGRFAPAESVTRQWYFYFGDTEVADFNLRGRLVEILYEQCGTGEDNNLDGAIDSGCRQYDVGDACVIDDDCQSLWCNPLTNLCDQFDCDPMDGCIEPSVQTGSPSDLTADSATLHGQLVVAGNPPAVARGFCYGDVETPAHGVGGVTCTQVGEELPGTGLYSMVLGDLDPGERVRYVAYVQGLDFHRYGEVEELVIAPESLTAISVIDVTHEGATLTWDAAAGATGYRIYRDGLFVEEVSGTTWDVQGLAPPPTAAPTGLSATTDRQGDVRLTWDEPATPQMGPIRDFGVRAVAYETPSALGPASVSVARAAYTLAGFRIEQEIEGEDTVLFTVNAGETSYDDTTAPAPELLAPSTFTATDGTAFERVDVSTTIPRPAPGDSVNYRIRQLYEEEVSSGFSGIVAGHRDIEEMTVTLYRGASSGDLDTDLLGASVLATDFSGGVWAWNPTDNEATPVHPLRWYTLMIEADGLPSVQSFSVSGFPGAIPEVSLDGVSVVDHTSAATSGEHVNVAPEPATVRVCWRLQGEADFNNCTDGVSLEEGSLNLPVAGLPPGRTIEFQQRSANMHGEGVSNIMAALTPPSAPASVQATQGVHEPHVRLTWNHNSGEEVDNYRVYRNGSLIQTLPSSATSFDDTEAPSGSVGAPTGINATGGPDSIHVTWNNPTPQPGEARTYQVVAVNGTGVGESPDRTGWRAAPTITNIQFETSLGTAFLDATDESHEDTTAPAPTINSGTLTASQGTSAEHVALNASGFSTSPGTSVTYRVNAVTAAGSGPWSGTATAARTAGPLEYRFEYNQGGGDFGLVRDYETSNTHNDTNAPPDGSDRQYRALVRAAGTSTVISNLATGFINFTPLENGASCTQNWQCASGYCSVEYGECRLPVNATCEPWADGDEQLDVNATNFTSTAICGTSSHQCFQSFTATRSGNLTRVDFTVWGAGAGSCSFRVYQGDCAPNCSGSMGTASHFGSTPSQIIPASYAFSGEVPVEAGQMYTLRQMGSCTSYARWSGSHYSGGSVWSSLNGSNGDVPFRTYVAEQVPNPDNMCWTNYCNPDNERCEFAPSGAPCEFDAQCDSAFCQAGTCS